MDTDRLDRAMTHLRQAAPAQALTRVEENYLDTVAQRQAVNVVRVPATMRSQALAAAAVALSQSPGHVIYIGPGERQCRLFLQEVQGLLDAANPIGAPSEFDFTYKSRALDALQIETGLVNEGGVVSRIGTAPATHPHHLRGAGQGLKVLLIDGLSAPALTQLLPTLLPLFVYGATCFIS